MTKKPTAVDLFSGCGGLTEGLKQAGFRVLAAVEFDPLAVSTYQKNHPRVRVWHKDIQKLHATRFMEDLHLKAGDLDLLAGCPPCQGFSSMTSLNGKFRAADPRNHLIADFVRFVRVLRPKFLMLENVPGLFRPHRQYRLRRQLKAIGYKVTAGVLDAADYGVPQRRKRFILLASRSGTVEFGEREMKRVTVREAFSKISVGAESDPLHRSSESRSEKVRKLIMRIPKNGGSRVDAGHWYRLPCHKRVNGFKDVYGRMAWDDVAPTITGGCCNPSKGRFLHPSKDRCITLREAAVLQSFPTAYYFSLERGKFPAAQLIGNALPPEFVRRHALAIRRLLVGAGKKLTRSN